MNEALIGLIGVVVGALASGVATYVTDRRAERHKLMLQRRAAARLIENELKRALFTLGHISDAVTAQIGSEQEAAGDSVRHLDAIDERARPSRLLEYQLERGHIAQLSDDDWHAQKQHLAEALGDDDWRTLTSAHAAMTSAAAQRVASSVIEHRSLGDDPPVLVSSQLEAAITELQSGLSAIGKLSRAG